MQQSLVILKPDCVSRSLTWEVTSRFERKWLTLVWSKMSMLSTEILTEHYGHLADKPFFPNILWYMQSAPVLIQIREWDDVVDVIRLMIGVTNPTQAQPWTVRWDFAISISWNIIHASESEEQAKQEISRFFDTSEIFSYARADHTCLYWE